MLSAVPTRCYSVERHPHAGGRSCGRRQAPDKTARPNSRRSGESVLLNAVAEALHGSTDVQQALARTLGLVAGLLGLRTGWVWLVDPETDQFYVAAAQRLPPYLQEPVGMSGRWCLYTD